MTCWACIVGSEGMLGVVTEVTVRLLPKPPGARALLIGFPSVEGAGDCVAAIIGAGIIPGGMEIMDQLAIERPKPLSMPATRWMPRPC